MTPAALRAFRHSLGLSCKGFAELLRMQGTHAARTVRRWEAGEQDIPAYVELVAELLQRCPEAAEGLRSK